ncbi:hypothetical protein M405DRAFT_804215 [Rhizopogon salebrosus TDB-379]|nr:hypothetical protein M405DRAFT_804215 [Rhizopogon salebrosus TDB-379]
MHLDNVFRLQLPKDMTSVASKESIHVRSTSSFSLRCFHDPDSGLEYAGEETEDDEDEWSDDTAGMFDFVTERNTEQNASIATHASSRDSSFANLSFIIPAC